MRRLVTLLLSGALVSGFMALSPAKAFVPTPHSVAANVWRFSAQPNKCVRNSYSAQTDSNGNTSGSITTTEFPCDSSARVTGAAVGQMSGTVSCLAVSGNVIVIAGTITSSSGTLSGQPEFTDTSHDNSTPSAAPNPDTDVLSRHFGPDCTPNATQVPLISGDVRIAY